jgi:lysyl-tRNA synthetase class 2
MKFSIRKIIDRYPGINIGVLVGNNLNVKKHHLELERFKKEALSIAKDKISDKPVTTHPFIGSWRKLYRTFGTKASDYRPSAESLVRRALKKQELPSINTAVDVYNAVSVKYLVPMGGFDTDKIEGNIDLRYSDGGEDFIPLGANVVESTYQNEVVYADKIRILTRRWNYRDCEETKITLGTENLVIFIDGSPEIPKLTIENATKELKKILEHYCGGFYNTGITNSEKTEIKIK